MITPLLIHKERLVRTLEALTFAETKARLVEAINEVDSLVECQVEQDRAHREEIEALMGTYDPVRRRREKECAGS